MKDNGRMGGSRKSGVRTGTSADETMAEITLAELTEFMDDLVRQWNAAATTRRPVWRRGKDRRPWTRTGRTGGARRAGH